MKWIAWAFAFLFVVLGDRGKPLLLSPLGELTVADALPLLPLGGDQYQVDMAPGSGAVSPGTGGRDYSIRVGEPFPDPY